MTAHLARAPRITVLGATGFIGSAVVRELAERPVCIRAVSRHPAPVPPDTAADIEVCALDLTAPGAVREAIEGSDAVVHAVAHIAGSSTWRVDPSDTGAEQVNVGIARALVDAATRRPEHPLSVVFTGTTTQAGVPGHEVLDGSEADRPVATYDRQKLVAEQTLLSAAEAGVVGATSLRLPTVFGYGPHSTARDKGVIASMARRALAGKPLTIWHDGTVRRDLLYIDDTARALVAALERMDELCGRSWLIGSGIGSPLGEVFATIADLVADRTGLRVPVVSVDPPGYAELSDFRSVTVDATAFRAVTGWRPEADLVTALRHTVSGCVREADSPARGEPDGKR